MENNIYNYLEITDLKDLLKKTYKLYENNIAYKVKIDENKYITYTHKQIRQMIDAFRNSTY